MWSPVLPFSIVTKSLPKPTDIHLYTIDFSAKKALYKDSRYPISSLIFFHEYPLVNLVGDILLYQIKWRRFSTTTSNLALTGIQTSKTNSNDCVRNTCFYGRRSNGIEPLSKSKSGWGRMWRIKLWRMSIGVLGLLGRIFGCWLQALGRLRTL